MMEEEEEFLEEHHAITISDAMTGTNSDSEGSSPALSGYTSPIFEGHYISLSERIHQRIESGDKFFSLEFFPPKTKSGVLNLLSRFDRMRKGCPLFCDVTWHPTSNVEECLETSSTGIAGAALNYCGVETMLHLICARHSKDEINHWLQQAHDLGIRNILALRGDQMENEVFKPIPNGFAYASELVKYIRDTFGDYFVIGVAGYPDGHPEAKSYDEDLHHLKEKVDAGADFIITQMFFDAKTFLKFHADCRRIGITVPIIAGVMPIQSYDSLRHVAKLSKLEVPEFLQNAIAPIRGNDEAIRRFGISFAVDMCRELLDSGVVPGLHFYTLNREMATTTILKQLGLWNKPHLKPLPWQPPANHRRCSEDVRPIFWSFRPKSYVCRTQTWDEFPTGRWGTSSSPAFGDLKEYYHFFLKSSNQNEEFLKMWGKELNSEEDVWEIFYCYLSGHPNRDGYLVSRIPWNEDELSPETALITEELINVNKRGVLTINSQPNVNGFPSTHPAVGWGIPGGYVYQKAYLEFFTSAENIEILKEVLANYPRVNYHIINSKGDENTNYYNNKPVAVTWGVFPGKEIVQPTVVDPVSFKVWKDEAFGVWREQWANLYPEGSKSRQVLLEMIESYYLVNLVDNDYPLPTCLWEILETMFEHKKRRRHACDRQKSQPKPIKTQ